MLRALRLGLRAVAAVSLGALSMLHVVWAAGSAWPAADRRVLSEAVGGFAAFPGAGPCLTVATLLGFATLSVAGVPRPMRQIGRLGSLVTSAVLLLRGGIGLAGAMPNSQRSHVFAELDRRVYSPICLIIALAALSGTLRD